MISQTNSNECITNKTNKLVRLVQYETNNTVKTTEVMESNLTLKSEEVILISTILKSFLKL